MGESWMESQETFLDLFPFQIPRGIPEIISVGIFGRTLISIPETSREEPVVKSQ